MLGDISRAEHIYMAAYTDMRNKLMALVILVTAKFRLDSQIQYLFCEVALLSDEFVLGGHWLVLTETKTADSNGLEMNPKQKK